MICSQDTHGLWFQVFLVITLLEPEFVRIARVTHSPVFLKHQLFFHKFTPQHFHTQMRLLSWLFVVVPSCYQATSLWKIRYTIFMGWNNKHTQMSILQTSFIGIYHQFWFYWSTNPTFFSCTFHFSLPLSLSIYVSMYTIWNL